MQQEESGQGAKKENPCLHLLLSSAQLLFLSFLVFVFFFNRDSANPVILSDCYIHVLCIKLVSRGYPAKYSNYVNQNVFKHLSLLAIFPPFLELGVLSLGKWGGTLPDWPNAFLI